MSIYHLNARTRISIYPLTCGHVTELGLFKIVMAYKTNTSFGSAFSKNCLLDVVLLLLYGLINLIYVDSTYAMSLR